MESVAPKNCFVEVGLKMVEAIQIQLLGKNRRVTKEQKMKISHSLFWPSQPLKMMLQHPGFVLDKQQLDAIST